MKHGGKRKGAGRKTLPAKLRRKMFSRKLFNDPEIEMIKEAARRLDISVSKLVRDSALAMSARVLDLPEDQVL